MKFGGYTLTIDWGHLLLLAGFAAFVVWYYEDAQSASVEIENTILIVPASVLALLFCVFVAFETIQFRTTGPTPRDATKAEEGSAAGTRKLTGPISYMIALGIYVFVIEAVGFDVATAAFVAVAMIISGERRPLVITAFSTIFAALCVYSLKLVLPLHLPALLF